MTDLTHYTEGVCADGAAILRDGVMMPIEEIVSELNRLTALAHPAQPEPAGDVSNEELTQFLFERFRGPIEFLCDTEEESHLMIRSHVKFAHAAIALDRSRRAPVPPAEALGASCRSLLEEVARMGDCIGKHTVGEITEISDRAAAWLLENPPGQIAQPAPPAKGEVGELVEWLRDCANVRMDEGYERPAFKFARAADLLEQRHPAPVPVTERLPGPEDCAPWPKNSDASAWCWMGKEVDGGWEWEQRSAGYLVAFPGDFTHWLPAHALPLPTTEATND
jgi:hypothetical protein